jgi:hypothetical protein
MSGIVRKSEIILYQTEDGKTKLEVRLEHESIWLTQAAMAELFQTTPQNITLHLKEIYNTGELPQETTCKENLQVQTEGELGSKGTIKENLIVRKEVADQLALEQYGRFNAHRLKQEADAEMLVDDAEFKLMEEKIKKLPKKRNKR